MSLAIYYTSFVIALHSYKREEHKKFNLIKFILNIFISLSSSWLLNESLFSLFSVYTKNVYDRKEAENKGRKENGGKKKNHYR